MKLHKDTGDSLKPCKHMEGLLNRTVDNTAPAFLGWYARYHAAHCARCGSFLGSLTKLLGRLHGMKSTPEAAEAEPALSPERWEAVEAAWTEAEK